MSGGNSQERRIIVFAGGVGAAKFLRGLARAVPASALSVVVNTADDERFFGLHVSPDLDTVLYTLGGVAHRAHGWGRAGDSFRCLEELNRFYRGQTWFSLGDRDLATHIYRTDQLATGKTLSQVTRNLAHALGVEVEILPMSDQPVRTILKTGRGNLSFQDYFVRFQAKPQIRAIELRGARRARPAPGVLQRIAKADLVIIAPSNPIASIRPILALPGVRAALRRTCAPVAAISPIVGKRAISGPAARMMRALGYEGSASGVARLYCSFLDLVVIDKRDHGTAAGIQALGMDTLETDIVIPSPARAEALARVLLARLLPEAML